MRWPSSRVSPCWATAAAGDDEVLLLPDLKGQLNDVRRVVITGPGNVVIATLERGADLWTIAERNNYPADVGKIRKNLLALAEARIVEEKTSSPEFYERLGVQDLADEGAGGVQLTLTGENALASVIIGQAPSGSSDYSYARRTGEATSWLITGQFDLGKTGGEWLDRLITDIPAERIASVDDQSSRAGNAATVGASRNRRQRFTQRTGGFRSGWRPGGTRTQLPGRGQRHCGVTGRPATRRRTDP